MVTGQRTDPLLPGNSGSRNAYASIDFKRCLLPKYRVLHTDGGNLGTRVKKAWKIVTFEPEDVREFRDWSTSNASLLNTYIACIYGYLLINYFLPRGCFMTNLVQASGD